MEIGSSLMVKSDVKKNKDAVSASVGFEAFFIKKMLDSSGVGTATLGGGEKDNSQSAVLYKQIHNQALADAIASSKKFGIADLIDSQLNNQ